MKTRLLIAAIVLMSPACALAQGARLQLDHLNPLAQRAKETVDITLDPALLKLASGFLGSGQKDSEAVQQLIAGLQGVYVKSFEFDRDDAYSAADVEAVRKQFTAPGWSRMVVVKEERETVDIYAWRQGDKAGGIGILVAEPRELTVVNIVGDIDLAKLASLQGQFGIPKLPLEQGSKPPKGK